MTTLHGYVLRELLKTLLLAVTALTVLFTMGGGLYNVVAYEGVSAGDLIRFLPLLIPIVVTLTLPMAALFAVTMVYGRLAADNELVACRAAGINIHRLFLSAVLLSVFVAGVSIVFGNFVIPHLGARLTNFARNNLRDMVYLRLQEKGYIHYREKRGGDRYTLTAEKVQGTTERKLQAANYPTEEGLHYLVITHPTFLHIDNDGGLQRFTVAEQGVCCFDTRNTPVQLTVIVHKARDFDVGRRAVYIEQQQIGPWVVPLPSPFRLSTADLRDLFRWREAPWTSPRLQQMVRDYLTVVLAHRFEEACAAKLEANEAVVLEDDRGRRYHITGASVARDHKGLNLRDGRVEVHTPGQDLPTIYTAARVELRGRPTPARDVIVEINLIRTSEQNVVVQDPRAGRYQTPVERSTTSLDGVRVPEHLRTQMQQYTAADVLDPAVDIAGPEQLTDRRISLQNAAAELQRKIIATIHFRLGYASSALVTLLMGAALGVIFRGARALAAFALAMIPLLSVTILMVLARQVSEDPVTMHIGPFVTWGSLVLVLVVDLVILRVGVRR